MSTSLIIGCFWVLASCVTAMLPLRRQYVPGVLLMLAAPVLLVWIGFDVGPVWSLLGLVAFGSLFRNPLRYFWAKARGRNPEVPR
ncbi:DUF2484 family protein [Puniceibacterium confluentis]|uniref:DUF2484 family protein n=1 Tax=Puniceibacterium confluentis TaxID=1958944 RepID=UPI0011B7342D|nr:DUF2484 family protein [Puniceibacterium confluentis]